MIIATVFNWLFGWDYIHWKSSCDYGIARVHKAPNGDVWYFRYRVTKCIDVVKEAEQVTWLTCSPEDYGL